VWDTVQLAASGAIFVLLGEQLPGILAGAAHTAAEAGHHEPWWLALYVVVIVIALATLRFAWVWTSLRLTWFRAGARGEARQKPSMRLVAAMSLAGVRGAITLAGVLTLPFALRDGSPFPARDLAIFLAAGVILVSLVLATVFLPPLLRRLELPPEDSEQAALDEVRLTAAEAAIRAVQAAQHRLADGRADADLYADAAARVMEAYRLRIDARPVDAESAALVRRTEGIERELRIAGLRAERAEIFLAGRTGRIDEVTARRLIRDVDLLEARYVA
jgi:CPA1 family monovalent cation:H+ antiporter